MREAGGPARRRPPGADGIHDIDTYARPRGGGKAAGHPPGPESRTASGIPSPAYRRLVHIHNGHPRLRLDRRAVASLIRQLDAHAGEILGRPAPSPRFADSRGVPCGELSIAFLTDAALARLHASFLGDPSATDVITFAGTPAFRHAGEICVSADAAFSFAAGHRRGFSEELALYVVHGWLHLAGHDDRQAASRRRMRAAEARALSLLRARRMIPAFAFARWPAAAVAPLL